LTQSYFEKGIEAGMAGNKIAKWLNDPYLYFKSLGAVARSHFYTGNAKECLKIGIIILNTLWEKYFSRSFKERNP
jgi:hypothetical protein